MEVKSGAKRTIWSAVLCAALILIFAPLGRCSADLAPAPVDRRLPVSPVDLSGKTSIVGITSWWICGPFVVDERDQRYSPGTEAEMFEKDYLAAAGAREAPLQLPEGITKVAINFARDPVQEPHVITSTGVFLNQAQVFPTPDVDSQLLYWEGYHVFKVIYAAAALASSTDQNVVLLAATNSPIKIWVNGVVLAQSAPGSVGAEDDTHVGVRVHLRPGRNTILVKLLCFPYRNDFGVWIATLDRARQFIAEQGGIGDVLTQIIAAQGARLRFTPIIDLFGGSPGGAEKFEIRDVVGRIVATRKPVTADTEIDTSALPEGLYSVNLQKGALANGELFFVGDLKRRLAAYGAQCASNAAGNLPCEALPALTKLIDSPAASFRLHQEKLIVFLLAQFEWSLRNLSLQAVIPDNTPRIRLVSFRSGIDGTTQLYYLHLPPDVQSRQPLPLVVVEPFNDHPAPFFEGPPTTTYLALLRYARFADQYHLSYIAPFGRGKLMPSVLAERDVLEAIHDAGQHYKVDDGRIFLTGECAAGRSAFLMAEDYPEIFAGVSTLSAATHETTVATHSPQDSANVLLRLRNLSATAIRLIHGNEDYHSPSIQASLFMQEAQKVGVHPEMMWLPGDSKFGVIEPQRAMFQFFATVKRRDPAVPRHVALAVTEPEHNHAFWLQVNQLRIADNPGYITAEVKARGRINVTATNVERAAITIQKLPPGETQWRSWEVVCNVGKKQRLTPDKSGQIVLNLSSDSDSARTHTSFFSRLSRALRSW